MSFAADTDEGGFDRNRVFAGACARRGVFLHPVHNWFLSAAHTERDIDQALDVAEQAFIEVRDRFA
jgi:glutamate-1-semialdehyde 2,1-aminomutase